MTDPEGPGGHPPPPPPICPICHQPHTGACPEGEGGEEPGG
jgi:hypothetical protein